MAKTVSTKLTDAAIRSAGNPERPIELRDHAVKGLLIRINPLGSGGFSYTWKVVEVTPAGKRRPFTLGQYPSMSIAEARKAARERLGTVAAGEVVPLSDAEDPTLGALIDDYERLNPKRLKSIVEICRVLRTKFPQDLKARSITRRMVEEWQAALAKATSEATSNRAISYLSGLLGWAAGQEILAQNPARIDRFGNGVRKYDDRPQRARYFSTEEWEDFNAVLDANAPSWLVDLIRVAIGSGARQGELLALTWLDVDLTEGTIHLTETKNGKPRTVPVTEAAWEVLRNRAEESGAKGLVFEGADAHGVPVLFDRLLKQAGIEKHDALGRALSFRSLRTTMASILVQKTYDLQLVSELLGHAGVSVTAAHYAHLLPHDNARRMREALR